MVALAATLGIAALGLTQCRMIDDSPTGVDLRTNGTFDGEASECVRQCNASFRECRNNEVRRRRLAMRRCDNLLDPSERVTCKWDEDQLHRDNLMGCIDAKRRCKSQCRYHEGSGGAGR